MEFWFAPALGEKFFTHRCGRRRPQSPPPAAAARVPSRQCQRGTSVDVSAPFGAFEWGVLHFLLYQGRSWFGIALWLFPRTRPRRFEILSFRRGGGSDSVSVDRFISAAPPTRFHSDT